MDYDDVDHLCSHINDDTSASELHGIVTGVICRSPAGTDIDSVLALLSEGTAGVPEQWRSRLMEFCNGTAGRLEALDFGFDLLLPGDDDGIEWQTEELGAWCRGYLLGVAAALDRSLEVLDGDAAEFITDLTAISNAQTDAGDETDRKAFAELVEYVRAGVQLVYETFRQPNVVNPTRH